MVRGRARRGPRRRRAARQVGGVAGGGVHAGAEGAGEQSDTVAGWWNTLCAAAKRLHVRAHGADSDVLLGARRE